MSGYRRHVRFGFIIAIIALVAGVFVFNGGVFNFNGAGDGGGEVRASRAPSAWARAFTTDFTKTTIDFREIRSGGPPKDGIPAIDSPTFTGQAAADNFLDDAEPVVTLVIDGAAKAYPLSILMWHEIVNDELAGIPVTVTFCPLCNSAVAFDRRVAGRVLDFGTTGKLRFSDLVMYDRQTETWWQQFLGEGIVGEFTGTQLDMLPVRVESYASYKQRFPAGLVQQPPRGSGRRYGANPYSGYDTSRRPFLYDGPSPDGIAPLAYVVAVDGEAWSLDLLQAEGTLEAGDLVLSWTPGMASALDNRTISRGRDLGNVVVQRYTANGLQDTVHDLTFAFSFNAFNPDGVIHQTVPGALPGDGS